MTDVDKNKATLKFLADCPIVKDSPLYVNFVNGKDKAIQYITTTTNNNTKRTYVDGSKLREFIFTLVTFTSVSDEAIVRSNGEILNENVEDVFDLQGIIDWITEQNEERNYPDFGDGLVIDDMISITESPRFEGINASVSPALAMYSMTIRIEYIDYTKTIWS